MLTTGATLIAVERCSLDRMWMPAQGSRSAYALLCLAAVRYDWREHQPCRAAGPPLRFPGLHMLVRTGSTSRPKAPRSLTRESQSAAGEMYEPLQYSRTFGQWSRWRRDPAGGVQGATLGPWRKEPVDELDKLLIQPRVHADSSRQIP
jgi:hypothetical protein